MLHIFFFSGSNAIKDCTKHVITRKSLPCIYPIFSVTVLSVSYVALIKVIHNVTTVLDELVDIYRPLKVTWHEPKQYRTGCKQANS